MLGTLEISLLRTFVLLVEEQSVTRVARRLHRTQPAISMQIGRLETAAGRSVFQPDRRRLRLTPEGETLLPYARAILQMHDDAHQRLRDQVAGRVTLGCPDLYAAFLLPQTLARFRASFPGVDVTVRCALSRTLADEISDGTLDVALATRMPDVNPKVDALVPVRREQLVWLGAEGGRAHEMAPIPLGMLPDGNLYRDYAIDALNRIRRPWRISCVSESIAGMQAMALADAAVIVLGECANMPGLRRLSSREGMPPLPIVDLVLWRGVSARFPAAEHLAAHLVEDLRSRKPNDVRASLPGRCSESGSPAIQYIGNDDFRPRL